jgi:hypothetical protein
VALVVVPLDVPHIDGLGDTRYLIKVAQKAGQVRVISDPTQVALEVTYVNWVKPQQGREQSPIRLREASSC